MTKSNSRLFVASVSLSEVYVCSLAQDNLLLVLRRLKKGIFFFFFFLKESRGCELTRKLAVCNGLTAEGLASPFSARHPAEWGCEEVASIISTSTPRRREGISARLRRPLARSPRSRSHLPLPSPPAAPASHASATRRKSRASKSDKRPVKEPWRTVCKNFDR